MRTSQIVMLGLFCVGLSGCNYEYHEDCHDGWDEDCGDVNVEFASGGRSHDPLTSGGRTAAGGRSSGGAASAGNAAGGASAGTAGSNTAGGRASSGGSAGGGENCENCAGSSDPAGRQCLWGDAALSACRDDAAIAAFAEAQCLAAGLLLESYTAQTACSGGHAAVRYECCSEPPVVCVDRNITLNACFDVAELRTLATNSCAADGSELGSFAEEKACTEGGFCGASFSCCSLR